MFRKRSEKGAQLPVLPGPVLRLIFNNLSSDDLLKCRETCILWNQVIKFYKMLPHLSDYFLHCGSLTKSAKRRHRTWSPYSVKRLLLNFIQPDVTSSSTLQSLKDVYLRNCAYYFVRPQPSIKILAFEEVANFGRCLSSNSSHLLLNNIHTLDLQAINQSKLAKIELGGIDTIISCMPHLEKLSLPLRLLSVFDPNKLVRIDNSNNEITCFSRLKFLTVQLPEMITILENGEEYICMITKVVTLLASTQLRTLQSLQVQSPDSRLLPKAGASSSRRKLREPEVTKFLADVETIVGTLGTSLQNHMMEMVSSKLLLKDLTLCIHGFPASSFDNTGILTLFAFLAMRGLKHLHLRVSASVLCTSLPTILHTMSLNYGCEVTLDVEFFLNGKESQVTSQYLLSLPEMYSSIRSFNIRFLADYDSNNHLFFLEDFIPFHTRLNVTEGQVLFKKLTTFKVQFEEPSRKTLLTFGWLRTVCPTLKHISIIVGRLEDYETGWRIVWGQIKDKLRGRPTSSVLNIFYLRGIIKSFPNLETLITTAAIPQLLKETPTLKHVKLDL
ncbi:hypothetical protein Fcan01_13284 [Folsomia candida]|uniref:F-box domain-containing protein n=1 Tax=Folsomia candida TaxID=158441 RepID=A0A226E327_FOLCA|nr:hypothetical protein Fcan01_13284 [Folsomia candida]